MNSKDRHYSGRMEPVKRFSKLA